MANGKRPHTTGEHIIALYGHVSGIKREIHTIKDNHLKHLHDDVMGIHKKLDENIVRIYDKLDRFLYTLLGFMATLLISLLIHFFFK